MFISNTYITDNSSPDTTAYLATSSQGGGGGHTSLYSNLKVIAVPVLATILHTAPISIHFLQAC